jgi:hypothetical protein
MARFHRRPQDAAPGPWLDTLAVTFTLDELLAAAGEGQTPSALSWLYAAIERGEIEPADGDSEQAPITYRMVRPGRPDRQRQAIGD